MSSTPAGVNPVTVNVPVAEICKLAGVSETFFYREMRRGRAPRSDRGVPFEEAKAWLDSRAAKKAAKVEVVRRLRELCGVLKEGDHG